MDRLMELRLRAYVYSKQKCYKANQILEYLGEEEDCYCVDPRDWSAEKCWEYIEGDEG